MSEELVLDGLMAEGEGADGGGAEGAIDEGVDEGAGQGADGTESGADGEGAGKPAGEGDGADPKPDGRNNPDAIRKHLAALKTNPETQAVEKALRDRLGKTRGYEEVYPTVKEAREVKQLLDSVGGRAAVTAAITSHATMQRVDQQLEAGDPAVLEDIFRQAPEGMTKLAPAILDRIAKHNPEAYQAMIVPHIVQQLNGDGVPGALNALVDAFKADNKDAMKDVLGRLVQYYKGLMQGAKPKEGKPDPRYTKLEEENAALKKQGEDAAISQTMDANLTHSADKIDKGLAADIKRLGLGPKAQEKLRQDVWNEIVRLRNADDTFKNTLAAKFDGRKPKPEALKQLNQFTDDKVEDAIKTVVETYYGPRKAAPKTGKPDPTAPKKPAGQQGAGKPGTQTQQGALHVSAPPDPKDINYDDPRTDTFAGKAVRKSDKRLVQWR